MHHRHGIKAFLPQEQSNIENPILDYKHRVYLELIPVSRQSSQKWHTGSHIPSSRLPLLHSCSLPNYIAWWQSDIYMLYKTLLTLQSTKIFLKAVSLYYYI